MSSGPRQEDGLQEVCFARWCSSATKVQNYLAHLEANDECDEGLKEKLSQTFFAFDYHKTVRQESSVYRMSGRGHESLGYRSGVVAVAVGASYFDPETPAPSKNKHRKRKGVTLIFPERALTKRQCNQVHTPHGCLTFTPAMRFHYDLECGEGTGQTIEEYMDAIIDIVRCDDFAILCVDARLDGVEPVDFSDIVSTVVCYAYYEFGLNPVEHWLDLSEYDGKSSEWQVRALKRLIEVFELSPATMSHDDFLQTYNAELQTF